MSGCRSQDQRVCTREIAFNASQTGLMPGSSGALIPGAKVVVTTAAGKTVGTATADTSGAYEVRGLAAGSYIVKADYAGFAPFVSPAIILAAGQSKRVDIAMAIEVELRG